MSNSYWRDLYAARRMLGALCWGLLSAGLFAVMAAALNLGWDNPSRFVGWAQVVVAGMSIIVAAGGFSVLFWSRWVLRRSLKETDQ